MESELNKKAKKTNTKKVTTKHTISYDFYNVYYYDDPYEFYYDHIDDFHDPEDAAYGQYALFILS